MQNNYIKNYKSLVLLEFFVTLFYSQCAQTCSYLHKIRLTIALDFVFNVLKV